MTTETIQTMLARYSCRAYTDQMPSDEALCAVAEAAIAAPSGINRQYWRVIVLKNKELIADLEAEGMKQLATMSDKSMYDKIMSRGGKLLYNAPCIIVIPVKVAEPAGAELVDLGIVVENIALAATSLGIDNVICGMFELCFAGNRAEEFKQRLNFPEGYEIGLAVLLGYAEKQGQPHELDYSKISFLE
jgi:nitroreductase